MTVGAVVAAGLAVVRPEWTSPSSIDFNQRQADHAAITALEQRISAALHAGRGETVRLTDAEVNRWLATVPEWSAPPVSAALLEARPMVRFSDDGADIAARVPIGAARPVLSIRLTAALDDEAIHVRMRGMQLGLLPIPLAILRPIAVGWIRSRLPEFLEDVRIGGSELVLPSRFVWHNGKRNCRVTGVVSGDGWIDVVLAPD